MTPPYQKKGHRMQNILPTFHCRSADTLGRASHPDGLLDPVSDFIGKDSVAGSRPAARRKHSQAKSAELTGANTLANTQKDFKKMDLEDK